MTLKLGWAGAITLVVAGAIVGASAAFLMLRGESAREGAPVRAAS